MRRALLLVLVGLAAFAAVYLTPGEEQQAPAEPEQSAAASAPDIPAVEFTLRADLGASEEPTPESEAPAVRNVTPENMTAAPAADEPPVRIATPEPVVEPTPARMERLYNPIVVSAGMIKVREREISLAGINAPAFDERCGEASAAWPCGRMARAALRRFIRGRAIECEVPAGADAIPDPARCEIAGTDISAWLIEQGWAQRAAGSGDTYAEVETAAREAKLGLWGEGRPDAQPEEVAASGG